MNCGSPDITSERRRRIRHSLAGIGRTLTSLEPKLTLEQAVENRIVLARICAIDWSYDRRERETNSALWQTYSGLR